MKYLLEVDFKDKPKCTECSFASRYFSISGKTGWRLVCSQSGKELWEDEVVDVLKGCPLKHQDSCLTCADGYCCDDSQTNIFCTDVERFVSQLDYCSQWKSCGLHD